MNATSEALIKLGWLGCYIGNLASVQLPIYMCSRLLVNVTGFSKSRFNIDYFTITGVNR